MIGISKQEDSMNDSNAIALKEWNSDTMMSEPSVETVSVYKLARSMTPENFARLLDNFLNVGGKGFNEGKLVGLHLRHTHRTLQRLAICFALGLIAGLSEQDYTDARNETAIQTAKKVAEMLKAGELPTGFYI